MLKGLLLSVVLLFVVCATAQTDTCKISLPNSYSINASTIAKNMELIFNCPVAAVSVEVFNRWGTSVHKEVVQNGTFVLNWDPSELPTGTYFYILKCNQLSNSQWVQRTISAPITLLTNSK